MYFGDTGRSQLKGLSSALPEDRRLSPCGWISRASSHLLEPSDVPTVRPLKLQIHTATQPLLYVLSPLGAE